VIGVRRRNADGPIEIRQLVAARIALRLLDAPLVLTDAVQMLSDAAMIVGAERVLQT
jgi:hypothetical protein